jgi:hypothetical protein
MATDHQSQRRSRTALLVTYTMEDPSAVGVFFRALRIAGELGKRGWRCVICNCGPIPDDPKVRHAHCELIRLEFEAPEINFTRALALFRRIAPQVILFGEYPLHFMEPYFAACRALVKPPVLLLDQYYGPASGSLRSGVDRVLLYGLRSMWPDQPEKHAWLKIVPPFIERVAHKADLPVPEKMAGAPWITILGFDTRVLRAGIEILAKLRDFPVAGITLSHSPQLAERMLIDAQIPAHRRLALPLQQDDQLFGLIAASQTVVLANGFMQIVEAVALGCPAVCIHRGIGMDSYTLDPVFQPFVSFEDSWEARVPRVLEWLRNNPFTAEQSEALRRERGGIQMTVDYVEKAVARPRWYSKLQRYAERWRRSLTTAPASRRRNADEAA